MKLKPLGANRTEITLADGTTVLFSYQTPVAAYMTGIGWCRTAQFFSRTTSKHINQWIGAGAKEQPQAFFDQLARRAT